MPSEATCMNLEIIILNEMSEKGKYDSTYIWSLKYDTINLLMKQKQTHRHKTNLWLTNLSGREKLGVWDQQIQTTRYEIQKQQGPSVQHRKL